jgi:Mrp family chromosome partitioning ATPase
MRLWSTLTAIWRLLVWIASKAKRVYSGRKTEKKEPFPEDARIAFDPATPAIEAIHQFANVKSARIIGLVGVDHDSGVSAAAAALANRYARGRKKALLIDANGLASASEKSNDQQIVASALIADPLGYSRISLRPSTDELLPLRDIERLKRILREEFENFEIIIIDTPPAHDVNGHALPATIVANACDIVLLICATANVTRTLIEEACANLRAVNAPLSGVIVNRREQPTLGAEIAREARRFKRYIPKTSAKLERAALESVFLKIHA